MQCRTPSIHNAVLYFPGTWREVVPPLLAAKGGYSYPPMIGSALSMRMPGFEEVLQAEGAAPYPVSRILVLGHQQ